MAVFRLTRLLTEDKVAEGLRARVAHRHPPEKGGVGYLITCPWCSSMYIGFGAVAARRFAPRVWGPVASALAASAAAGLLSSRDEAQGWA